MKQFVFQHTTQSRVH